MNNIDIILGYINKIIDMFWTYHPNNIFFSYDVTPSTVHHRLPVLLLLNTSLISAFRRELHRVPHRVQRRRACPPLYSARTSSTHHELTLGSTPTSTVRFVFPPSSLPPTSLLLSRMLRWRGTKLNNNHVQQTAHARITR